MNPARDRGGRGGADIRRRVDLGFDHLTPELRHQVSAELGRLARRWVVVFSDVEGTAAWREDLTHHGLNYVRTGAWIKLGCTPQFSGDRPASGFEALTIAHQPGRKRWNGGGRHAIWSHPIVFDRGHHRHRHRPAQKPEGLLAELVDQFADDSEVILDPFARRRHHRGGSRPPRPPLHRDRERREHRRRAPALEIRLVSTEVNKVAINKPDLIEPTNADRPLALALG